MIGLFIILIIMGAVFLTACALILGGMVWTGRIAVPGSDAHRLNRARFNEKIALHEASRSNFLLQKMEADRKREFLEAQSVDDLQKVWDESFRKQLEAGEAIYE